MALTTINIDKEARGDWPIAQTNSVRELAATSLVPKGRRKKKNIYIYITLAAGMDMSDAVKACN